MLKFGTKDSVAVEDIAFIFKKITYALHQDKRESYLESVLEDGQTPTIAEPGV